MAWGFVEVRSWTRREHGGHSTPGSFEDPPWDKEMKTVIEMVVVWTLFGNAKTDSLILFFATIVLVLQRIRFSRALWIRPD